MYITKFFIERKSPFKEDLTTGFAIKSDLNRCAVARDDLAIHVLDSNGGIIDICINNDPIRSIIRISQHADVHLPPPFRCSRCI